MPEINPTAPKRRRRTTPLQFDVLVIFHKHRVRKAGRPPLPALSDVQLEANFNSRAAARSVILALVKKGDIERINDGRRSHCYRLTADGRVRAAHRAKVLAEREKRYERAAAQRARERSKLSWRSKPRKIYPTTVREPDAAKFEI